MLGYIALGDGVSQIAEILYAIAARSQRRAAFQVI